MTSPGAPAPARTCPLGRLRRSTQLNTCGAPGPPMPDTDLRMFARKFFQPLTKSNRCTKQCSSCGQLAVSANAQREAVKSH
eukprot:2883350-Lingulodinium_polyedra.AAC.1